MTEVTQDELFEAVQSFDHQEAKQLFDHFLPKIDEVLDGQNATLLHVAANYNNHQIITYFLQQYNQMASSQPLLYSTQRKRQWLNRKDNEGFSCVHYAVFRGNTSLAFSLEEHGADIYAINRQGLTVLHIAAQGDSPVLMYYYLSRGMKISTQDSKGSTSLHWACYSGQQNSAYALMAWGAEIDKQDFTYGMTPLHLAVMSGNGRIVKKLLVRGCDRTIPNYTNRLPLDIARQNQYKNITEMIVDKRGLQQFFNIKTPYRLIGKFTFPYYFLIVLFLTNYILNVSFVLFEHFPQGCELAFSYLIMGLIVVALFFVASHKQPGYIGKDFNQNDFDVLRKNHPSKICFQCMIVKPDRSRHCEICHRCVSVYDHHCPWVANCVGSKNYLWFYMFLLSMETFMIFTIIFEIINIVNMNWENIPPLEIVRIICVVYGLICSSIFLLPLSYLFYVQTTNCLSNQTTFERYGYQNKSNNAPPSKTVSQQSQSLHQNLLLKHSSLRNSSIGEKNEIGPKPPKLQAEIEAEPMNNCYKMCCTNADNLAYQIGKCS